MPGELYTYRDSHSIADLFVTFVKQVMFSSALVRLSVGFSQNSVEKWPVRFC